MLYTRWHWPHPAWWLQREERTEQSDLSVGTHLRIQEHLRIHLLKKRVKCNASCLAN
jgi:hypothetical protein